MNHSIKHQHGVTVIELMIAMTLSLVLLNGMIQVFLASKQTYRTQQAMSEVQENGRFVTDTLSSETRMAGYMGCSSVNKGLKITNNVAPAAPSNGFSAQVDAIMQGFTGAEGVEGEHYDGVSLPTRLSNLGLTAGGGFGSIVADSDVLIVTRASSCPGGNIIGKFLGSNANVQIASNAQCKIKQNDIVMVSDCRNADIFGVSNNPVALTNTTITHGANWNNTPKLASDYGPDSKIFKIKSMIFYIGEGSSGEPSFFKRELVNGAFVNYELVENVETLTIRYGEDLDGDQSIDVYVDGANIVDKKNVMAIRFSVVTRSRENSALNVNKGDKRLRKTFHVTAVIRNRVI